MGLELRRVMPERTSLEGGLRQALVAGMKPATVIDVGAAYGGVTRLCAALFPEANLLAVEALIEYGPSMEQALPKRDNARVVWAAAGRQAGIATLNVHSDFVGSSLYRESEGEETDGDLREVAVISLDDACRKAGFAGPYLLKIDVQGAEMDVLLGAAEVLTQTDYVILEVSLFEFFLGGPQIVEMVAFMQERGFVPYDIFGMQYRMMDNALSQVDLVFVTADGALRKDHRYATREQRIAQNTQIRQLMRDKVGRKT